MEKMFKAFHRPIKKPPCKVLYTNILTVTDREYKRSPAAAPERALEPA